MSIKNIAIVGAGLGAIGALCLHASKQSLKAKRILYRKEVWQTVYEEFKHSGPPTKFAHLNWKKITPYQWEQEAVVSGLFDDEQVTIREFHNLVMQWSKVDYNNALRFDLSPDAILGLADEIMRFSTKVMDKVALIPLGGNTFENTIQPLLDNDYFTNALSNIVTFVAYVSVDKKTRDASTEAAKLLTNWEVEQRSRVELYKSIMAYSKTTEARMLPEGSENKRYLEKTLKDFERSGLHLDEKTRARLVVLEKTISTLGIEFGSNLGNDNTLVYFTKEELLGIAPAMLESLRFDAEKQKYEITLQYPHYFAVMKNVKVSNTRKVMYNTFNSRCLDVNTAIIEELVELRHEKALLLDFKTHSEFVLDMRMAKNPETVMAFIEDLRVKLQPSAEKERKVLLSYKAKEAEEMKVEADDKINPWDFAYFQNMVEEKEFNIDHNEIKQYFPVDVVTKGLLEIYQTLLSLKFEEQKAPHVWHEDVKLYNVIENKTDAVIGQFYLDLHPRKGKFSHAACFGLIASCKTSGGGRQNPAAAMVANFPSDLLLHSDVRTYFHEFGHVMHQLCSKTETCRFAGTAVERDFVEAPSQMLENWVFEREALILLSGHKDDNSKKLPDNMIDGLIAAKDANCALKTLRQLALGLMDQTIHTRAKADTAQIYADIMQKILKTEVSPKTNIFSSFGHLAGGYDASYYGYMWSEVFSQDMYVTRFQKEGIFNPEVGTSYKECILEKGGSVDGIDMLTAFLGRAPSNEAFLIAKGLAEEEAE